MKVKKGQRFYIASVDVVEQVQVVELGDGGRNFKASYRARLKNPVVVVDLTGEDVGGERVVDASWLYSDPLAAAIESARMLEEAERD